MTADREALLTILHGIDAYDFEQVIADLWERQGWTTSVTQGSNDKGVDVIAERNEPFAQKLAIQAKRYDPSSTVGSPEVQQYASLRQQISNVDAVVVVTTGNFTSSAEEAASSLNVKLVDGAQLYEIFEANDAYDILYRYANINQTSDKSGAGILDSSTSQNARTDEDAITISRVNENDASTRTLSAPDSLSDLISLRKSISERLNEAQSTLSVADRAFDDREFGDAVVEYNKIMETLAEVQEDISRYEQGYGTVDTTAASHLNSPAEFVEKLNTLYKSASDPLQEAKDGKEKIDALDTLVEDMHDGIEVVSKKVEAGNRHKFNERYDQAQIAYAEAEETLSEVESTLEIYRGMAEGYSEIISEEQLEPVANFDIEEFHTNLNRLVDSPRSERVLKTSPLKNIISVTEEDPMYDKSGETNKTPKQIVDSASGSFSKKVLTKTRGRLSDQKLIDYLSPGENLEFVFWHRAKGFRITKPDGTEETPHHSYSEGARFLMITDRRIIYVAGLDDYDESQYFPYEEVVEVYQKSTLTTSFIFFKTTDGDLYKFCETGDHSSDVSSAVLYIDSSIKDYTG